MKNILRSVASVALAGGLWWLSPKSSAAEPRAAAEPAARGWLNWRGPHQSGMSLEKGLPDQIDVQQALWKADFPGQSTAVMANGKLYIMGFLGDGPDLQEGVACFDAETGKQLWDRRFNDFLSDTIYGRYATSSPTIDPETGNVYMQGTQGILAGFTPDGKRLWQHSLMEALGRLTFPNSRTASPVIDQDLIITRGITANWGAQGAGGDRFYAFDKKTGELVWGSSPGDRPKDNSFSQAYLGWWQGRRALFAATGDGSIVCVNARTGDPLWRIPIFRAGINASLIVHNNDKLIAIYGTPYEPGEMMALKMPSAAPTNAAAGPVVLDPATLELWRADLSTSTSSPILAGDRVYVVTEKGDLCSVDAPTGKILWKLKIGIEQRNACPLYADGKLYVPMLEDPDKSGVRRGGGEAGAFYVVRPTDSAGELLSKTTLSGKCFGTPAAYNGKIYVQTTRHLYCFGKAGNNPGLAAPPAPEKWPAPGPAAQLQFIPSEVLLTPGEGASFRARALDANGFLVEEIKDATKVKWGSYIPPTARVRSTMQGSFNAAGRLTAAPAVEPSAGAFEGVLGNLRGYIRGRVLPDLPFQEDFEKFTLNETTTNNLETPTAFAYPPLPWIGARFKFEVRDKDGTKALTKTIDNKFFQRATVFVGHSRMKNYTIEADVMSEGAPRKMSEVGLINQRYCIVLKGNEQKLEINSNLERLRVPRAEEPPNFRWQPNVWYRLKSRVDIAPDGSGKIMAKAWKRDEPEPEAWAVTVNHRTAHTEGAPGLFGFAPQEMRVYIDNIKVTPNGSAAQASK